MKILITGGAGFVGSYLAKSFRAHNPKAKIVALDNLKRRGSENNLSAFKKLDIEFVHGDVRNKSDFDGLGGNFDVLIEASAEPSVHAGVSGSPGYLLDTNLLGTLHCLEFARKHVDRTIFLSTSRVYSIAALKNIELSFGDTRVSLSEKGMQRGLSTKGISEDFDVSKARSLYGATKLASEMMCQEYAFTYGTKILINRCGVIAGPGQFGKVDQGVFTMWVANHVYNKPLKYLGFGGLGKQVRDLLHPFDLFNLISKQLDSNQFAECPIFNAGGGNASSTSLLELTEICRRVTGNSVEISSTPETAAVDVPYYISDNSKVERAFSWQPEKSVNNIIVDIFNWINENKIFLKDIF